MKKLSLDAKAHLMNGCSGGLSRFYRLLLGRDISCRYCCDEHDLAYREGGGGRERRLADRRLQRCAARAGKRVPGWLERLRERHPLPARLLGWLPYARQGWRWLRSWLIYAAVRLAGWYAFNWHKA